MNLAIAVNPDLDYVKVQDKKSGKSYVLLESSLGMLFYASSNPPELITCGVLRRQAANPRSVQHRSTSSVSLIPILDSLTPSPPPPPWGSLWVGHHGTAHRSCSHIYPPHPHSHSYSITIPLLPLDSAPRTTRSCSRLPHHRTERSSSLRDGRQALCHSQSAAAPNLQAESRTPQ